MSTSPRLCKHLFLFANSKPSETLLDVFNLLKIKWQKFICEKFMDSHFMSYYTMIWKPRKFWLGY